VRRPLGRFLFGLQTLDRLFERQRRRSGRELKRSEERLIEQRAPLERPDQGFHIVGD
jgi:hypothetical protein